MTCAPSGGGPSSWRPEQPCQHRRRDVGEDLAGVDGRAVGEAHDRPATVGRQPDHRRTGAQLGAAPGCRRSELGRDGAHAPNGQQPVTRPAPDDVMQEAAVGLKVVGVRERSDQAVRQHGATHLVIGDAALEQLAERSLEQVLPRVVVTDDTPERIDAEQRRRHRRKDALRQRRRHLPELVDAVARSLEQRHVEPELVDDLLRHQADEVGVPRQLGVVVGEDALRSRRCRPLSHCARGPPPTAPPQRGRPRTSARCARRRSLQRRRRCHPDPPASPCVHPAVLPFTACSEHSACLPPSPH